MQKLLIFGTSKQIFAKTFEFPEKRRPETCTVEFVETKQVTVVRAFFPLLASVISISLTVVKLLQIMEFRTKLKSDKYLKSYLKQKSCKHK